MKACNNYASLGLESFLSCSIYAPRLRTTTCLGVIHKANIINHLDLVSKATEVRCQPAQSYREPEDYRKNTTLYILGIDPGLSGAIALITLDLPTGKVNFGQIWDIPTKDGKSVQILEFAKIIKSITQDKNLEQIICCIERIGEMPTKQDPLRAFKMGFSAGVLHAVLVLLSVKVSAVKPHIWKASLGLSADKKQSIEKAKKIFPDAADFLKRAKDHDRAEALLLAYFYSTLIKKHGRN